MGFLKRIFHSAKPFDFMREKNNRYLGLEVHSASCTFLKILLHCANNEPSSYLSIYNTYNMYYLEPVPCIPGRTNLWILAPNAILIQQEKKRTQGI